MSEKKKLPFWKEGLIQVGSGGTAGFVEICLMHPLDLVKTRLQLQSKPPRTVEKTDMSNYRGIIDCFKKMLVVEGPFSYWKGILPPIIAETPKRAIKFLSFEQYKKIFLFGAPKPTKATFFCAGTFAGFTEAIFVNPFEVVKVQMQANKSKGQEMVTTWIQTKRILREHGWGNRGLMKGLTSTMMRAGVFNCFYLGFYSSVKAWITPPKDKVKELITRLCIGFVAGTGASCMNIPFDVAKSRIQGPQPVPNEVKYNGCIRTLMLVYKEEGFFALYKGLLPKVVRLGPGGAIILVVYDYLSVYLTQVFSE